MSYLTCSYLWHTINLPIVVVSSGNHAGNHIGSYADIRLPLRGPMVKHELLCVVGWLRHASQSVGETSNIDMIFTRV